MKDVSTLYQTILEQKASVDSLTDVERSELFNYMCEELEKGNTPDGALLRLCANSTDTPVPTESNLIIERIYGDLNGMQKTSKKIFYRRVCRRILAATVAVFSFIVVSLVTASAFGADFVEHIKTIFYEEQSVAEKTETIFFESPNNPIKTYEKIEELFASELSRYYYPSQLPKGVSSFSVTVGQNEKTYYTYKLKDVDGKIWLITASDAKNSYMPMGYSYETATTDGKILKFVYTLSRNSHGVSGYTVYTKLDGVMYTLSLPIGDWNDVGILLNSFTPAK